MPDQVKGIIYDSDTLALRRVVICDSEQALQLHIQPGEKLIVVPYGYGWDNNLPALDAMRAMIEKQEGRTPPTMEEIHKADASKRAPSPDA